MTEITKADLAAEHNGLLKRVLAAKSRRENKPK